MAIFNSFLYVYQILAIINQLFSSHETHIFLWFFVNVYQAGYVSPKNRHVGHVGPTGIGYTSLTQDWLDKNQLAEKDSSSPIWMFS